MKNNNCEYMDEIDGKFGINYNNLRLQLLISYKDLCQQLNSATVKGDITIESNKIQYNMDQIRFCIGILAPTHINGNLDFSAVGTEISLPTLNL